MKKLISFASLLGFVVLIDLITGGKYCSYSCTSNYDGVFFNIAFFLLIINMVLFILLFLPPKISNYWWKFARISIPIIFLISLAINLELHHDPQGTWQDIFDVPALILLYSIFTIGSVSQIWKGFRSQK